MTTARPWVQHYQTGVPAEIVPPTTSLVEMCEQSVREAGDHVAMEFFGRRTTYTELGDQIDRAAEGLRRLGVKPGDRVGLVLPNCPQHIVAFYACLRVGAIVVEHNPLYTAPELRHIFEDHRAEVIIAWDVAVEKLADLPRDLGVRRIIAVNLLDEMPRLMRLALSLPVRKLRTARAALHRPAPDTLAWRDLLAAPPINPDHPRPGLDDVAVIQYTSGTTGVPKGAMLTHRNLYSNALQGEAWMHDAEYRSEIFYALLPMFHAFGMTLYLTYGIRKQAHIVLFPRFDVDLVLKAWKKSPATVYCAVPPIYRRTAEAAKERGVDISSARFCISGAMALTDEIVHDWEEVSGGLLVEGYGLTESSPVALGNPFARSRRTGTIGIPFPSTEMKVVDVEDPTKEVARGEQGELLVRGPQVFQGYWKNPEETAKMLLPGGWLRTGDVVVQDADGFTTIVDRLKELIITGGFNVSPSEVERVLRTHDAVEDAAVVGRRNASGGEDVVAVITVAAGQPAPTLKEIRAFAKQSLAAYKAPRDLVIVDELPRSMLGKVLRKQVRDELL
ncbi:long-chain-fatty-acid--CoA ligase [uncultured Tessaracoccus sp.]|uniref:long-chain-fatty-acid--CoA ligase n=1 Tax=uncultured Tessaracoccus sp. TaxID=905023 RepID=UPI0025F2D982|nr:long-chain-fatty-acid--CoA ligase [uncultured Tessaracoccus sp.]